MSGVFAFDGWRIGNRWKELPQAESLPFGVAYRRLVRAAGDDTLLFVRIGRYVEFYGPQRPLAERVLGLRAIALPRFGYAISSGFPAFLAAQQARRALRQDIFVARFDGGTGRVELLLPAKSPSRSTSRAVDSASGPPCGLRCIVASRMVSA